jgi:hypothetical protein
MAERLPQPEPIVTVSLDGSGPCLEHLGVAQDLRPPPPAASVPLETRVSGDRKEPRPLGDRHDPAAQGAEGVKERGLQRVLGLLGATQLVEAVAVDSVAEARIEVARLPGGIPLGLSGQYSCATTGGVNGHSCLTVGDAGRLCKGRA